ncbi:thioesterase family protein [Fulvivirgaceae bacterium BMA12]|uniref:Thioesterase family protein n=1 Tax=Agaribacillus aureus TaxID=3051825 RepID=A0ABT8LEI0_9BACT|nr:thioesterase family protein [Fulvivirgaceae bacterium BMA12]
MYESSVKIRVRYSETDQMGYVYYGNYAGYYEVARVESLRSLGFAYKELEGQGVMMPVLENKTKFLAPAKYDELLTIKARIASRPGVRIIFHYEIYNEQSELINTGETVLAFVNMTSGRPCRPPQVMQDLLDPYFN